MFVLINGVKISFQVRVDIVMPKLSNARLILAVRMLLERALHVSHVAKNLATILRELASGIKAFALVPLAHNPQFPAIPNSKSPLKVVAYVKSVMVEVAVSLLHAPLQILNGTQHAVNVIATRPKRIAISLLNILIPLPALASRVHPRPLTEVLPMLVPLILSRTQQRKTPLVSANRVLPLDATVAIKLSIQRITNVSILLNGVNGTPLLPTPLARAAIFPMLMCTIS